MFRCFKVSTILTKCSHPTLALYYNIDTINTNTVRNSLGSDQGLTQLATVWNYFHGYKVKVNTELIKITKYIQKDKDS